MKDTQKKESVSKKEPISKKEPKKKIKDFKNKNVWRNKIKYKEYSFKLTLTQRDAINKYCKKHKKTAIKLFKSIIKDYIAKNMEKRSAAEIEQQVSKKQLSLFD